MTRIPTRVGQFGVYEGQRSVPWIVVNKINAVGVFYGNVVFEPHGRQLVQGPGVGDALEFGSLVAFDHVFSLGFYYEIRGDFPGLRAPNRVYPQVLTKLVLAQQRVRGSYPADNDNIIKYKFSFTL